LHTIFSKFAITWYSCNELFYVGSSIKATCSSNCHILALEADFKLFDEVLESLKKATPLSKSLDSYMSGNILRMMKILQQWILSHLLTYVSKSSYWICYMLIFTSSHLITTFLILISVSFNCLCVIWVLLCIKSSHSTNNRIFF
jgi:hypothetical protein